MAVAQTLSKTPTPRRSKLSINNDSRYEQVSVGIVTVLLFLAAGASVFAIWEEWNLFDGAYYSFITLSTIGFGDIVPGKSLGSGGQKQLLFCSFYLLFGMALIAMCFKLMQDDVVAKARWFGTQIGLLSFDDEDDEEDDVYSDTEEELTTTRDKQESEDILTEDIIGGPTSSLDYGTTSNPRDEGLDNNDTPVPSVLFNEMD